MDSRILYLDTLTEPIVRLRIVFVYIIVTMDKECSKTSFAFAIRRFITCLIVHGLHITLPAVTHISSIPPFHQAIHQRQFHHYTPEGNNNYYMEQDLSY